MNWRSGLACALARLGCLPLRRGGTIDNTGALAALAVRAILYGRA